MTEDSEKTPMQRFERTLGKLLKIGKKDLDRAIGGAGRPADAEEQDGDPNGARSGDRLQ